MYSFTRTANRNRGINKVELFEGQTEKVQVDYSPWQVDNATVTAVTWEIVSGSATITGEALASGVASANVACTSDGRTLLKLTATAGSFVDVTHIEVYCRDPQVVVTDYSDYV